MITRQTILRTTVAAGLAAFGLAGCGHMSNMMSSGSTAHYHATLSPSQEVPPTSGSGTGTADVELNSSTNMLSWKVSYSGLTGPATAAHIHGPAAAGANAPVLIPFANVGSSPFEGKAQITAAQAADIAAGRTYVNIHTAQNKGGEIRGQLEKR
jgi:CHRD domain